MPAHPPHDDVAALPEDVLARAERWAAEDPDPAHRDTLRAELDAAAGVGPEAAAARAALAARFAGPLAFGTAGLRAEEGPGESRMNRLVVRRTAAGLAAHLWDGVGRDAAPPLAVVGYDARRGSAAFAADTAAVLTAAGVQTVLLPDPLPTPVLAFAVRHLSADAGVMVTASHNPPADNGYKVYLGGRLTDEAGRGAQIVSPADAEIAARIDHAAWAADIPLADDGWTVAGPDLLEAYRAGNLTLANAIGTGVADDKSIYPYVPKMIEFYLGEKPILQNVPTWMCRKPDDLRYVLDHLHELVVKEVHGAGGYGMLIGPAASQASRNIGVAGSASRTDLGDTQSCSQVSSASSSNGFSMKSAAPLFIASTASGTSP